MEHPERPADREIRENREQSEHILEQVIHLTDRRGRGEAVPPTPPETVKLVHKQAAPEVTEEMLEQLQTRTVRTETQDQVTRQNVHHTDVTQIQNQVVRQTTEDISELINRTLARQMRSISDQVYRQMERRLQTERSRRGRL